MKIPRRNDPLQRHRNEMKKVMTMTNKAIISTSLKEKNDLLMDIQERFTPICEAYEKHQTILHIKNDELTNFRKKLNDATIKKDTLQRNTAFYSCAELVRSRHKEETLINSIQFIEPEISKHHPVSNPNLLKEALSLPEKSDMRLFTLIDIGLSRVEELSYAFKKRLIAVEESQETTDMVKNQFGSINDLIFKVTELEKENAILKNDEKKYIHDALTRRRKLAQTSPICSRMISSVLTHFINDDHELMRTYKKHNFTVDYQTSDLTFEDIINDVGFNLDPSVFEADYFGNTTETDLLSPILTLENTQSKVEGFKNVNRKILEQNHRLINEIATIPNHFDSQIDVSLSRMDKIAEANEKLLKRVHKISNELDDQHIELADISKELLAIFDERHIIYKFYINSLSRYRKLTESHCSLIKHLFFNKQILLLIYRLSSQFGLQILHDKKTEENEATHYLVEMFHNDFQLCYNDDSFGRTSTHNEPNLKNDDKFNSNASGSDTYNENLPTQSLKSMQQRLLLLKKKKGRHQNSERSDKIEKIDRYHSSISFVHSSIETANSFRQISPQLSTPLSSAPKSAHVETYLYFLDQPKTETIHALAYVSELAGYLINHDIKFKSEISKFLKNLLRQLRNETGEKLALFGKPFESNLNQINICANSILVRQKEDISVQTDVLPLNDQEIQTVQIVVAKQKVKPNHK